MFQAPRGVWSGMQREPGVARTQAQGCSDIPTDKHIFMCHKPFSYF